MAWHRHIDPMRGRRPGAALLGLAIFCASCGGAAQNTVAGGNVTAPGNGMAAQAGANVPILQPEQLAVDPQIENMKERYNVSGAACNAHGVCLLISDEKRYARFFTLQGNTLRPTHRFFLLADTENGTEMDESDGEGVAFANGAFYIVGSHSRSKSGEAQASRHFVFRIPGDMTAAPAGDVGTRASAAPGARASLDSIIAAHPILRDHLLEPPGDTRDQSQPSHGVNVEGIAVVGDDMFIGFRGPLGGDRAIVLKISAAALFGGDGASAESYPLRLGPGQGVRDLAAVQGGLLVLSGPERRYGVEANPQFFLWRQGSEPILLGRLAGAARGANPESITILEETATEYRVLVLWDSELLDPPESSLPAVPPMIVRVPKPAA
jgi:hypothetical protein